MVCGRTRTASWLRWLRHCGKLPGLLVALAGCSRGCGSPDHRNASLGPATPRATAPAPISSVVVSHGELDTRAPDSAPELAATVIAATVYKLPNTEARKLGYLRLGGKVRRDASPVSGKGCKKPWYRVYPMGYVCTQEATTDLEDPLVRAAARRPDLSKPLPYRYGFVRATAPQYLRVPTKKQQLDSEFKLMEHLDWFAQNAAQVQSVVLGANDVPLDARGVPRPGLKHPPGYRPTTELSRNELLGGDGPNDPIPFWLEGGKRLIPNVSGFDVPSYAVFADRVRRKTGLSLIAAFETDSEGLKRRFSVAVDLRLVPATKIKPDTGSPFHGVELTDALVMPFAWVVLRDAHTFKLIKGKDEVRQAEAVPRRAIVPLTGNARIKAGERYYQTRKDPTRWLRARELAVVAPPSDWPESADKGGKWIDISLRQQTLVLYEGKRPWYATLVSTGRDRLGDPKTTLSTPQGIFRLRSKHIAAAMDSEENSSVSGGQRTSAGSSYGSDATVTVERLTRAVRSGARLSEEDQRRWLNVQKGRDPEYGVTKRRGSADFELRDVPWIQYFASGYALHGAYWHDVFGIPRSHGCVNLAPVDARLVFAWTDPPVPDGWHGINVGQEMGEGTLVRIRE
ncbi:MAG: L,D-transpeptidase [Polyangiaceae bacterium]|nr:L,D-transpeptidase [Polyangiaceae bacterium]